MKIEFNQNTTFAMSLVLEGITEPIKSLVFSIRRTLGSEPIVSKILEQGVEEMDDRPYREQITYKIQLDSRDTLFLIPNIEYVFDIVVTVGSRIKTLQTGIFVVHPSITNSDDVLAVTPPETPKLPYVPFERDVHALETIGDLHALETSSKKNVVSAINELNAEKIGITDKGFNTVSKETVRAINELSSGDLQNSSSIENLPLYTSEIQAERNRIDTLGSEASVQNQEIAKNNKDINFIRGYTYRVREVSIDWGGIDKTITNWSPYGGIWHRKSDTFYSSGSSQYKWDNLNRRWTPYTWNNTPPTLRGGLNIWFDGVNHYHYNPRWGGEPDIYILRGSEENTWEKYAFKGFQPKAQWAGLWIIYGKVYYLGSDSTCILHPDGTLQPVTWYLKRKDGRLTAWKPSMRDIWFDGETYYSMNSDYSGYKFNGVDTWTWQKNTDGGASFPDNRWYWHDGYNPHLIGMNGNNDYDYVYRGTKWEQRKAVDFGVDPDQDALWHDSNYQFYYSDKNKDLAVSFCRFQ